MVSRMLLFSILFFSLSSLPTQAATSPVWLAKIFSIPNTRPNNQSFSAFSNLILSLATRPDVTSPVVVDALVPAAREAGMAIQAELKKDYNTRVLQVFSTSLQAAIEQFDNDYRNTEPGTEGTEARALIYYELYQNLFAAAEASGLSPERLKMAYLKGCAIFEKRLEARPLSIVLTFEDRELIDLLLLDAFHQIEVRTLFLLLPKSFETINPTPVVGWAAAWQELEEVKANHLSALLLGLEQTLADPDVLSDGNLLISKQYNEEALNDLLMIKIGLEVIPAGDKYVLQVLAERMAVIGGVMAGMTPETLLASGVFTVFDDEIYDGGNYVLTPITDLVVYEWINAEMSLRYRPVSSSLSKRISHLGGDVPVAPDFGLFAASYLPMFQLEYDLELCDEIYSIEKKILEDRAEITQQPLTMQQRYALLQADTARRAIVIDRLKGVGNEEKSAIRVLLSPIDLR